MGGPSSIDTATIAFRRVLSEATAGEQARVDALVVLAQRTLFVATWPGPNQIARTLTNSDGETALPLFTGLDALETTATRFGWRDPDGSLQFRQLGARDALRHALARGVHFVVIDIGTDHSVEFARDELEPLLQLQTKRSSSGPFAATGEPQATILDAIRKSTSRPPTTASSTPPPLGTAAVSGDIFAAAARRPTSTSQTGLARPPSVRPPPALSANDNREGPVRQRNSSAEVPIGHGARMEGQMISRDRALSARVARDSSKSEPPATPRSSRTPPAPTTLSPSRTSRDASSARDGLPRPTPPREPTAGRDAPARSAREAAPRESVSTRDVPTRAASRQMTPREPLSTRDVPTRAAMRESAQSSNQSPTRDDLRKYKVLAPPKINLTDGLRDAIASALRGFPEVEWACVASDDSEMPLIGVRVDPSFLNRVADITDAILDHCEKQGLDLQVLLLNNSELVKSAHKFGQAIYPWRK
jgi:hypothetical protein